MARASVPTTFAAAGRAEASDKPSPGFAGLMLAALGIVYGDIGTSPLYAIKETFAGPHPLPIDRVHVLGVLSLVFWTITLVVSVKYVAIMMRADNRGEGGSLALLALLERSVAGRPMATGVTMLGILATALFYGDCMITPSLSVLSAVEGLNVAAPELEPYIVPLAVGILIALFLFQRWGTGAVGALFGPVMVIWFVVLGAAGVAGIAKQPQVLFALSPHHALIFIAHDGWVAFLAFGSVFLAVTGAEALYADMGHFGKLPIRLAWYLIALPGLLLNYFGQGARLLQDPASIDNPFLRLYPEALSLPMVVLAAIATIIASQAVISGAFSVTQQVVHLGYLPRLRTIYTSEQARGQIYIPFVNWTLLVFVVALVVGFGSSSDLASAYGIAVSGTMILSTVLISLVAIHRWSWSARKVIWVFGVFFLIDAVFLAANATKIPHGGWFPLAVAVVIYLLLTTWKRGRVLLLKRETAAESSLAAVLPRLKDYARVQGTAIFLTSDAKGIPAALLHNLKHNKVVHEINVLLTVVIDDRPRVAEHERIERHDLGDGFHRVLLKYGYREMIDIPRTLANASESELGFFYLPMGVSYFISRETLVPASGPDMTLSRKKLFVWMWRTAVSPMELFRLPTNRVVELGTQVNI